MSELQSKIAPGKPVSPVRVARLAKRPLAPAHLIRHWPGGMIYREIRVALSAVVALAALMGLMAFLIVLRQYFHDDSANSILPSVALLPDVWRIAILIVFFLMGILCGAEEAENGTENFALRLPVTRLQIYLEKTAGSLLCIAIWFILSVTLMIIIFKVGSIGDISWKDAFAMGELPSTLSCGIFLFLCGQAAGAWTGRVILGSVLGGTIGVAVLGGVKYMYESNIQMAPSHVPVVIIAAASALAMAAAITRFLTREGR